MNTLSIDLLGLINNHLDAFSSIRLAMSTGISMFFEGCSEFDIEKEFKWFIFGIYCKESNAFNDAVNACDIRSLEFLNAYNQGLLTPDVYPIDHRIKSVRFHYILKAVEKRNMKLLLSLLMPENQNMSILMHSVNKCIKIGWFEGVKVLDPIYKRLCDTQVLNGGREDYDSMLLIDVYKYGSEEIIEYYENVFADELFDDARYDRLIGMLSSSINYDQHPVYIDLLVELSPQTDENERLRKNIIVSLLDEKAPIEKIYVILSLFRGNSMYEKLRRMLRKYETVSDKYETVSELLDVAFRNDNIEFVNMLVDILIEMKNKRCGKNEDVQSLMKNLNVIQKHEQLSRFVFERSIERNMISIYEKILGVYPYFKPNYRKHIDYTSIIVVDTMKMLIQNHGHLPHDELKTLIQLAFEKGKLKIFEFLCSLI